MIKGIRIQNFRGFKNVESNNFSRINLIVGKNNVGKTAFLEALFLYLGRQNPILAININAIRGFGAIKIGTNVNFESPWSSLFYNFNTGNLISITCFDDTKETNLKISVDKSIVSDEFNDNHQKVDRFLKIKEPKFLQPLSFLNSDFEEPFQMLITNNGLKVNKPNFSENTGYFLNSRVPADSKERAELFTKIDTIGRTNEIIEALNYIEPRLKRLSIGIIADEPIILGDIEASRLIPLPLMGDGMLRLLDIIIRIINIENGAILIDEIENGLHHSVQENIWKVIGRCAEKYNVQVFASTHSLECVNNAYAAFSDNQNDVLRVHRIERVEENIRIKTFNSQKLATLFDMNLEVR